MTSTILWLFKIIFNITQALQDGLCCTFCHLKKKGILTVSIRMEMFEEKYLGSAAIYNLE